jgi:hypothetical protein
MNQESIEEAIRNYVANNGISSSLQKIKFTVTRKGGTSIDAEVILGNEAVTVTSTKGTTALEGHIKRALAKSPSKPTKEDPVAQADNPINPAIQLADEPPFVADAVIARTKGESAHSKSLSG